MKEKKKFKIKKVFKNSIFTFILGIFLTSIISVSAASLLLSSDVTYDNSSSGMSATTVQAALDELYEQAKKAGGCPEGYKCIKTAGAQLLENVNVVTSGSGLYADSVESGRYIYRGSSPDNYITFNGESAGWRIISVESDGTIKIIKKSKLVDRAWSAENSRSAIYCNYDEYGCNSWGSRSTTLNASGTVVTSMPREYGGTAYALPNGTSTLNTYLNGTSYYSNLTSSVQSQIASHNFNVGVLAYNSGQTIDTDVIQESEYKWKGKIALANASDYIRASTNSACTGVYAGNDSSSACSSNNWMYTSSFNWWTLSPYSASFSHTVWFVSSDGRLNNYYANYAYGVRPVLHLSADITLSGSGKSSDPYTISG